MERTHATGREMKAMSVPLHDVGEDGEFEGYACLFGKEDLGHDIIRHGAFSKSLGARGQTGVKLLYQHDPNQPIGQWLTIHEDARGLYVKGRLALEVAKAREVMAMMKAGILDGLSIGFRTIRGQSDRKTGVRTLLELDLWEISIVTFPMQPGARISSMKSDPAVLLEAPIFTKRELERKLTRDAGLSRSTARTLLAGGYQGLIGKQDAASTLPQTRERLQRLTRAMDRATRLISTKRGATD